MQSPRDDFAHPFSRPHALYQLLLGVRLINGLLTVQTRDLRVRGLDLLLLARQHLAVRHHPQRSSASCSTQRRSTHPTTPSPGMPPQSCTLIEHRRGGFPLEPG